MRFAIDGGTPGLMGKIEFASASHLFHSASSRRWLPRRRGFTQSTACARACLAACAIATNALLSDDLDYAVCTGPGIAGAIKGLPIKLIMTTQDKLGYLLLVKSNVQKLTDLRGKTIGISTYGSQLYLTSVTPVSQSRFGARQRR